MVNTLDANEVAERLGVDVSTIRRKVKRGELPPPIPGASKRKTRWRAKDIDHYEKMGFVGPLKDIGPTKKMLRGIANDLTAVSTMPEIHPDIRKLAACGAALLSIETAPIAMKQKLATVFLGVDWLKLGLSESDRRGVKRARLRLLTLLSDVCEGPE